MTEMKQLKFRLNGSDLTAYVSSRTSLADFLRDQQRLTGTHIGCDMGACGACLVRINGKTAHACLVLAAQVSDMDVFTIEGLDANGTIAHLQREFHERNALQCGFCTSGMLMSAAAYLEEDGRQDRAAIRDALSGNYCRCTGYEAIVDAICAVAGFLQDSEAQRSRA